MKVAVIGDVHLGCTKYTNKRVSDFAKQFNLAVKVAQDKKIDCIFLLGDVFDSSAYRRSIDSFANALSEISESLMRIRERKVPIFAIAGNHEYGRGREAGEIRILNGLGFLRLLRDETVDYDGLSITGVSWKSDRDVLRDTLKRLAPPNKANSILLLHQFCSESKRIPPFLGDVGEKDLQPWGSVFVGHHHQYESLGKIIAPGSLEIQAPDESNPKGFVIFDTDTRRHEFVRLDTNRRVKFVSIDASEKSSRGVEKELSDWIVANGSQGALLVIRLNGQLKSGRSADINWRGLQTLAIQRQCLSLAFDGGIEDLVRTVPQIRASINFGDFLRKKFGAKAKVATEYADQMREMGDDFGTQLRDKILDEVGRK